MAATASRTLELLDLLQTNRHWPGPELAERLGVTARTLRRDVERLRDLGYRVAATRGTGGGYRLEPGATLPPLLLSDAEAVATALGLRATVMQGLADGTQVTLTALAKLEQVLPPVLRRRVAALAHHVHPMAPRSVGGAPADVDPGLLGQLALACRDAERVRFRYTDAAGSETRRVAEPHAVVSAERHWYLVAWDRDRSDWRTFRADRVADLVGTGVRDPRRPIPASSPAAYVAESMRSMWPAPATVEVVAEASLDDLRRTLGPWAPAAEAVDAHTTRWRLPAESAAHLVAALAWLPEEVAYRLSGPPQLLAAAATRLDHLGRAIRATAAGETARR